MQVYEGDNFNYFWDKHLFYFLFVRPNYSHVSGGSTFSDSGVDLVPLMLRGYLPLHALYPYYWTITDRTNILSLSSLKLYSGFCGASHEALSSCNFYNSQGQAFLVKKNSKNNLDYINLQVIKKDKTHPKGPHRLISPSII